MATAKPQAVAAPISSLWGDEKWYVWNRRAPGQTGWEQSVHQDGGQDHVTQGVAIPTLGGQGTKSPATLTNPVVLGPA